MPGRIFIDTNIVIYALGQGATKEHLVAPLFIDSPFISTQVLSESANVASKRFALPVSEIRTLIFTLEAMCRVKIISLITIHTALKVLERYRFSWYDSLIVDSASLIRLFDCVFACNKANEHKLFRHE